MTVVSARRLPHPDMITVKKSMYQCQPMVRLMQHRLEVFLARLLTDPQLRERFLADPSVAAEAEGLSADECRALAAMAAPDLRTAARSFAYKRRLKRQHGRFAWLRRLFRTVA